jgi:hypothetical protein
MRRRRRRRRDDRRGPPRFAMRYCRAGRYMRDDRCRCRLVLSKTDNNVIVCICTVGFLPTGLSGLLRNLENITWLSERRISTRFRLSEYNRHEASFRSEIATSTGSSPDGQPPLGYLCGSGFPPRLLKMYENQREANARHPSTILRRFVICHLCIVKFLKESRYPHGIL